MVDSVPMKFYVTSDKLQLLLDAIEKRLLSQRRVSAREVAKVVGRAVSIERALDCRLDY
jgi:hypothetical protein